MATDAQLQQLSVELTSLTRTMRDMIDASSRTVAAQRANTISYLEQVDEMEKFKKTLTANRTLTKEEQKQIKVSIDLKRQEQALERAYIKARNESLKADKSSKISEIEKQRLATVANNAHQRLIAAQNATTASIGTVNTSMGGLTKTTNLTGAALAWFGSALSGQGKQLLAQNKANSGVVEGTNTLAGALLSQQNLAMRYAITGEELAKVSSANRQAINAMGGTEQAFKQLDPAMSRLRILTGSLADGTRLATEAATDFAKKGVTATAPVMERYINDLVQLQRQTGMNTEVAAKFYDDIAQDADSIDILRSARKDEREAILQSQRALVQQAIAAGMSAEQAKEAAKMLNKMTAAKPLDRLKQAAKVRALSGAMGIAGGDEAAQAIIAGKRATAEQKQALAKFSENAANAMDQAAGQGLGSEIFASTLLDKLDLEQYYGKNSNFSTTLGDTMKPAFADLTKAYIDASQTETAQAVLWAAEQKARLDMIISGTHWLGPLAAGVGSILAYLAGGKLLTAGKNLIGGGGAAGTAGAPAGTAKAATAAGGMSKALKILGPLGAAAAGTYEGYQEYQKDQKVGKAVGTGVGTAGGALGGAAIGAAIGTAFLPVIGTAIGGIIGGVAGAWGGGKAGKAIGGATDQWLDSTPGAQSNNDVKNATLQSADRLTDQVKKLDTSNELLKRIADMSEKQIELAERQLVAMTMTDKERSTTSNKTALRKDSKFGAQYNYV
jgi:hypothetical protein